MTSKSSEKQRKARQRAKKAQELIDVLREKFPKAFFDSKRHMRPLKVGIFDELMTRLVDAGIRRNALQNALRYYCHSLAYLSAVALRRRRADLDGKDVGEVSDTDSTQAKALIVTLKKEIAVNSKNKKSVKKKPVKSEQRGNRHPAMRRGNAPATRIKIKPKRFVRTSGDGGKTE